ncbi:hypothetical protein QQX98_002433 [Neonectria punicea]|uniref:LRAT domain-containing protein n=1 Tax=Neonectria punicea TaxID=979145 RepID=A0ABR1HIR3_9HYPO
MPVESVSSKYSGLLVRMPCEAEQATSLHDVNIIRASKELDIPKYCSVLAQLCKMEPPGYRLAIIIAGVLSTCTSIAGFIVFYRRHRKNPKRRAARQAAVLPVNIEPLNPERQASFERDLREEFDDGALLTHEYKYELRLAISPKKRLKVPDIEKGILIRDRWTSMGRWGRYYEYRIQPCTLDEECHREAVTKDQFPAVAGFYSSLIGWTRKSKAEVDADCKATFEKLGRYSLVGNNCQHFVRNFAVKIVEDKAEDWEWFFQRRYPAIGTCRTGPLPGLWLLLRRGWRD